MIHSNRSLMAAKYTHAPNIQRQTQIKNSSVQDIYILDMELPAT